MQMTPQGGDGRVPQSLIEAARLGARLATRRTLAMGLDGPAARKLLLARFEDELVADEYSTPARRVLMAAYREGVDEHLAAARPASACLVSAN